MDAKHQLLINAKLKPIAFSALAFGNRMPYEKI
jgi:hypothetical protein